MHFEAIVFHEALAALWEYISETVQLYVVVLDRSGNGLQFKVVLSRDPRDQCCRSKCP